MLEFSKVTPFPHSFTGVKNKVNYYQLLTGITSGLVVETPAGSVGRVIPFSIAAAGRHDPRQVLRIGKKRQTRTSVGTEPTLRIRDDDDAA